MKKILFLFLVSLSTFVWSQDIMTAPQYFQQISEKYGTIQDYRGTIIITKEDSVMTGEISFQAPDKLRIDFSKPEDQILVTDGENLSVYIPRLSVIMEQELKPGGDVGMSSAASQAGLEQLKKSYNIAFTNEGRRLVSLDNETPEKVTKLILKWKSSREAFRELVISIDQNSLIRRIEGLTVDENTIVFDFTDLVINQGLPENHFVFDNEASANIINNFLFSPEE